MTPARRTSVTSAYRSRLWAVRAAMMRRLEAAWARIGEEDIRAGFDTFVPVAVVAITAAQARSQTLTRAYVRAVSGAEPVPVPAVAGSSLAGTMEAALIGILPTILGMIGRGMAASEALRAGAALVTRTADNETTRAVDAEAVGQASRATGWIGRVNAPCDICARNAGPHPFSEPMTRHPNCKCDRELTYREEPTGFAPGAQVRHRDQTGRVGVVVSVEGTRTLVRFSTEGLASWAAQMQASAGGTFYRTSDLVAA